MSAKMKKIGDLMASLGKYMKDGEEKTRWGRAGTLFQRDDGSMVVKIDMTPIEGNGWLSVFTEDRQQNQPSGQRNSPPARPEGRSAGHSLPQTAHGRDGPPDQDIPEW